jgi:hypothetical protein
MTSCISPLYKSSYLKRPPVLGPRALVLITIAIENRNMGTSFGNMEHKVNKHIKF